jgi:hypothetical protein
MTTSAKWEFQSCSAAIVNELFLSGCFTVDISPIRPTSGCPDIVRIYFVWAFLTHQNVNNLDIIFSVQWVWTCDPLFTVFFFAWLILRRLRWMQHVLQNVANVSPNCIPSDREQSIFQDGNQFSYVRLFTNSVCRLERLHPKRCVMRGCVLQLCVCLVEVHGASRSQRLPWAGFCATLCTF